MTKEMRRGGLNTSMSYYTCSSARYGKKEEEIPTEWKEGYLINLPKKGALGSFRNYRGITLLYITGKLFNPAERNKRRSRPASP
ncbi:hypothetical protein DPMN_085355 [Dreissena polymorpha]|uniref:Uncharacterized protein n=1 Tax=Dreissena polymorpha TaxID=45954 RepID=A0A9D3YG11_DREPO|nr:hypothetical protein DPMN_085355 [Dreissena polymorpha]